MSQHWESIDFVKKLPQKFSFFISLQFIKFTIIALALFLFAEQKAKSDTNTEGFIEATKLGFPASGELTVKIKNYHPQTFPPPKANEIKPLEQTFYAAWAGTNFMMEELTPNLNSPTNMVSGLMVGRQSNLYWHAVGTELNLYVPQTGVRDDNPVTHIFDFSLAMVRAALLGGFDLGNPTWSGKKVTFHSNRTLNSYQNSKSS